MAKYSSTSFCQSFVRFSGQYLSPKVDFYTKLTYAQLFLLQSDECTIVNMHEQCTNKLAPLGSWVISEHTSVYGFNCSFLFASQAGVLKRSLGESVFTIPLNETRILIRRLALTIRYYGL